MGQIRELGRIWQRDHKVLGVPSSLFNNPNKAEGRAVFDQIDLENEARKAEIVEAVAELVVQIEGAAEGNVSADSWNSGGIELVDITGGRAGQPAIVWGVGTTHTDPVSGLTVPDQGRYAWSASPAGWKRTGPLIDVDLMGQFRAVMWVFLGDGDLDEIPTLVNDHGKVIESRYSQGGRIAGFDDAAREAFRAVMWIFLGDGDLSEVPDLVNDYGKVISTRSALTGQPVITGTLASPEAMTYVASGVLRIVGGMGGDRVLNNEAGKTWVSALTFRGSTLAVYTDGSAVRHAVRVAHSTGDIYPDGELTLWTNDGQSNAEAQAQELALALHKLYPNPDRLLMSNLGPWLGQATVGGASVEFDPDGFTGFVPLMDTLSGAGHGTLEVASAALAYAAKADLATGGWVPNLVVWSNAEGGQTIANLLDGAPAGFYAFDNRIAAVDKAATLADALGLRLVYRWQFMAQGESDSTDATLGAKHELYRSETEAAIPAQDVPLRMLSAQMSSFRTNSAGARSILEYALTNETPYGDFWCIGPTYHLGWAQDYLHNSSVGHDLQGEYFAAAAHQVEETGSYRPLHMTAAQVTGTNEITVTLSEPAVNDEAWQVAAITNKGIAVVGRTVSAVSVVGSSIIITTSTAAAGATAVQAAMVGHAAEPAARSAATVPRSTIRSVASLGTSRRGIAMHKPLCHQEIAIT